MSFTTNTVPLHSIRCLQFIALVWITNIAFKRIELKAPVIKCVAFTIRMRWNFSPLYSRMRCNSIIDCVVCFATYRRLCTRMRCNIYGILRQLPLVNTESPCVLLVRWKNMPKRIHQNHNPRRFHQRYPEKKRLKAFCILCISWVYPIFRPKSFSIRWIFGT